MRKRWGNWISPEVRKRAVHPEHQFTEFVQISLASYCVGHTNRQYFLKAICKIGIVRPLDRFCFDAHDPFLGDLRGVPSSHFCMIESNTSPTILMQVITVLNRLDSTLVRQQCTTNNIEPTRGFFIIARIMGETLRTTDTHTIEASSPPSYLSYVKRISAKISNIRRTNKFLKIWDRPTECSKSSHLGTPRKTSRSAINILMRELSFRNLIQHQ